MAHGILQALHPEWEVYSAGTKPARQVNPRAIQVIAESGGANETCPALIGKVRHRLHIGFEDPLFPMR